MLRSFVHVKPLVSADTKVTEIFNGMQRDTEGERCVKCHLAWKNQLNCGRQSAFSQAVTAAMVMYYCIRGNYISRVTSKNMLSLHILTL